MLCVWKIPHNLPLKSHLMYNKCLATDIGRSLSNKHFHSYPPLCPILPPRLIHHNAPYYLREGCYSRNEYY